MNKNIKRIIITLVKAIPVKTRKVPTHLSLSDIFICFIYHNYNHKKVSRVIYYLISLISAKFFN